MSSKLVYWVWMTGLKGIGPVLQKKLLDFFKTPDRVYNAFIGDLKKVDGIGSDLALTICESRRLEESYGIIDQCFRKKIQLITINDPLYPDYAKKYPQSPILLYLKGHLNPLDKTIGIVGARRCTDYGKNMTIEIASFLAEYGIPIISGLARGIDGYAHTACLKKGGYPLAFLGHGFNYTYPKEHQKLFEAIAENGALLTQFPPDIAPHGKNFPKRNALIAYFSQKLVVVEAGKKSGALITAEIFKSLKRPLFAVPHDLNRPTGLGTNQLIADGSRILIHPSQLLFDKINKPAKAPFSKPQKTLENTLEEQIYKILKTSPKSAEEIENLLKIPMNDLLEILILMEMADIIFPKANGHWAISTAGD